MTPPLLPVVRRPRVAVSCAHVGSRGARLPDNTIHEESYSRAIAHELVRILAPLYEVRLVAQPMSSKPGAVNDLEVDCCVEAHLNVAQTVDAWDSDGDGDTSELVPDPSVTGFFALFQPGSVRGHQLASAICAAMAVGEPGRRNRGPIPARQPFIARPRLDLLALTRCPAVIVECAHLTSPLEVELLRDPTYPHVLAAGIAAGVQRYFQQRGPNP